MKYVQARDVLYKAVNTIATQAGTRVIWDHLASSVPGEMIPWIRPSIIHTDGRQASLSCYAGTMRYDRSGLLVIQVFVPAGGQSGAAYETAQYFIDGLQAFRHDTVWLRNIKMVDVGIDGAFSHVNVSANFRFDQVQ